MSEAVQANEWVEGESRTALHDVAMAQQPGLGYGFEVVGARIGVAPLRM